MAGDGCDHLGRVGPHGGNLFLEDVCPFDRDRRCFGNYRSSWNLFSFGDCSLFISLFNGSWRAGCHVSFVPGCSSSFGGICRFFGRVYHLLGWIFLDLWFVCLGIKKTPIREFFCAYAFESKSKCESDLRRLESQYT